MHSTALKPAIAFFRLPEHRSQGDSLQTERALVETFAARNGYEIVYEFVHAGARPTSYSTALPSKRCWSA